MANIALKYKIGTFEYLEDKIRTESTGTSFGKSFEWLCKYFLMHSPKYRGMFKKIWLWNEWPDNWGTEKGIDLVAKSKNGDLWAIQAKCWSPDHSLRKSDIDSFLSESNRKIFSYRLLIATTDKIGSNAQDAIEGQEKLVGTVLRSDLITVELVWPKTIGKVPKKTGVKPQSPKEYQKDAIKNVVRRLKKEDRGQLIMACGTGKTLTSMWITEKRKDKRILILFPSLSLISQTIDEWKGNCSQEFEVLAVCSDETVVKGQDTIIHSTRELGLPVTTDPGMIRKFVSKNGQKRKVVFSTYQSSDCIALAQKGSCPFFDLVIADEAHRCVGSADSKFSLVLHESKIKAKKRLFMTATPRYFTEKVKQKAGEEDFELTSMDNPEQFGPLLHSLDFGTAIEKNLLSDYQVVVFGVTDREVKSLVEEGRLVRDKNGVKTDAQTLAAQIGLLKAIRKYNLKKLISFHSSVTKAERFVDQSFKESLLSIKDILPKKERPTGKFWTTHISGKMPTAKRKNLLDTLKDLDSQERGLISNCQCLSEGVNIPTLDGVAFIDPKRSVVDVIQAVGRAIRKAEGKKIGTIVIPVSIVDNEDPDEVLRSSVFEPVWKVIKALRAHDPMLAEELDELRVKLIQKKRKLKLPVKIIIDLPKILDLKKFQKVFTAKALEQTTATWDSMVILLQKYGKKHNSLRVPKDTPEPWTDLGVWVDKVRAAKRRGFLSPERISQLEEMGFSWRVDGQTLDDTKGLLNEMEFREESGLTNIAKYRKQKKIKPVGYGITNAGVSPLYSPSQIPELKKELRINLDVTTGLLNEYQFRRKSGLTNIRSYRKQGLIKPVGYGITKSGVSPFYHPRQIPKLKKKLGVTLDDTKDLLNAAEFRKESGLTNTEKYREQGLIKPVGYGMTKGGRVSAFYHPSQIPELKKKLGITLDDTTGLFSERQLREMPGFSNIAKYRKDGLIEPVGYGITSAGVSPFYSPKQIPELEKIRGVTLGDTTGLIYEQQFRELSGLSRIGEYRKQGLIKPVGYGKTSAGVGPFYHPSQIPELKKKLGITLDDTTGLFSERQLREMPGFSNIAKYRKDGLIEPVGYGMANSGVIHFYYPKQIKELKKKLKEKKCSKD